MFDEASFATNETNLNSHIAQANYYLTEYEKEVARAQGASGVTFRSKEDALGRIKVLMEFAPEDERVKDLFERARACVMGGAGNIEEVDASMTIYLQNEENLRRHFAQVSEKAWNDLLAANRENMIEKVFPAPDVKKCALTDLKGKMVVLTDLRYPDNQFTGLCGEYVWNGSRSEGMYFVRIDGREWLGPYEAVKRYRRMVDTTMNDVKEWSILAQITNVAFESTDAGENKLAPAVFGWEIEPVALYVPGHVMAVSDEGGEHTGRFIDEEKVEEMKEAWYTVKEVPADVTPERLVEIFMSAIKEKNYKLYVDCIDPSRRENPNQISLINYHWDLHQERFHGEYVYAKVDAEQTEVRVKKGYNDKSVDAFFLRPEEVAKLKAAYGEKEEEALVVTIAMDEHGKQLGTPAKHTLKRVGDGRWHINTYEVRF